MAESKKIPSWSWDKLKYYIYADQEYYNEPPICKNVPGIKDTTGKILPEGVRIPDWKAQKVSDCEELSAVERRLKAIGLKNPWLRNEVYRYDRKKWGTAADQKLFIFRTLKYGFAAFIVTQILWNTVWKEDEHHHEDKYKLLYEQ